MDIVGKKEYRMYIYKMIVRSTLNLKVRVCPNQTFPG